jgi:hypothetical protein
MTQVEDGVARKAGDVAVANPFEHRSPSGKEVPKFGRTSDELGGASHAIKEPFRRDRTVSADLGVVLDHIGFRRYSPHHVYHADFLWAGRVLARVARALSRTARHRALVMARAGGPSSDSSNFASTAL